MTRGKRGTKDSKQAKEDRNEAERSKYHVERGKFELGQFEIDPGRVSESALVHATTVLGAIITTLPLSFIDKLTYFMNMELKRRMARPITTHP